MRKTILRLRTGDLDCESPCNSGNRNSAVGAIVKYPLTGQPYKKAHEQCKDSDWTTTLMFWNIGFYGRCVCRRFDNGDPMSTTMVASTAIKEDSDKAELKLQTMSGKNLSKVMLKAFLSTQTQ